MSKEHIDAKNQEKHLLDTTHEFLLVEIKVFFYF